MELQTKSDFAEAVKRFEAWWQCEVIDRPVEAGKFVHKGDVLLVLKKDDEQRRYNGAKAELDRANALLAQAKVSVERARANIIGAQAEVERLTAQCKSSEFELNKAQEAEKGTYSEQELLNKQVQHDVNLALKKAASAKLEAAHSALAEAQQNVNLHDAAVTIAETQLGDAAERLEETTIIAKE